MVNFKIETTPRKKRVDSLRVDDDTDGIDTEECHTEQSLVDRNQDGGLLAKTAPMEPEVKPDL